jgi:hypothetical protein
MATVTLTARYLDQLKSPTFMYPVLNSSMLACVSQVSQELEGIPIPAAAISLRVKLSTKVFRS